MARPRPILCIDTCDFLDVVRRFAEPDLKEANLYDADAFRTMLPILIDFPDLLQPVVSYLVRHEWDQNIESVVGRVKDRIEDVDRRIALAAEACKIGNVISPNPIPSFASRSLADGLVALASAVLDRSMVIAKDESCVERALGRVMDRKRPSHKNLIKDSIHWEHYLELSRRLVAAGHSQGRFFVSANKSDFRAGTDPTIHPDLMDEMLAAGLQFSGRMDVALRKLGLET